MFVHEVDNKFGVRILLVVTEHYDIVHVCSGHLSESLNSVAIFCQHKHLYFSKAPVRDSQSLLILRLICEVRGYHGEKALKFGLGRSQSLYFHLNFFIAICYDLIFVNSV